MNEPKKNDYRDAPTIRLDEIDLQSVIDRASVGKYARKSTRVRDRLYASELGSCARAVWSNWRHPRPHDEEFERGRGMLGHAGEWVMGEHLRPILLGSEVTFTNHRVSGRADFFVRIGTEQIPVEVKTTYALSWAVAESRASHVLQAAFYAMSDDAPYAILVYLNLGNYGGGSGKWVALRVPRMDAVLNARVNALWDAVHSETPPDCEHPGDCWDCGLVAEAEARRKATGP